ncbi:MAG: aminotransferase class I/II-fold pyridoxal phosphate-dependent enzyme, partial [Candidatus Micrarchaeota archaeon]|nr:aminotransferase class I/II-fold pyridoxal phosphate-dependent enzyme [Candidatus Micrarchaeota archaeon]
NPTGTVLPRNTLKEIVDLANEHNLVLVSDEIYDEIVYNGAKFTSMSQLAKGVPHVILNGASKNLDATGFRIGFMIVPEKDEMS